MPLIRKKPIGPTTRSSTEAYHYQPLRHRKKVVRLSTLVPHAETFENPRFINVEEHLNTPRRVKVHDCHVIVGADMYLVTGYWYRYGNVNRAVKAATGLTWRGELVVVRAGRYIPYLKTVSRPRQADLAAAKFIIKYKSCSNPSRRFPTMLDS